MAATYRGHDTMRVDEIDTAYLMGARVMVGHFPDGSREIKIAHTEPVDPENAERICSRGELPEQLTDKPA